MQADSLVPSVGTLKGYDRYAYVLNRPINYNDPSGNKMCDAEYGCSGPLPKYTATSTSTIRPVGSKISSKPTTSNSLQFYFLPVQQPTWVGWYGGTNFAHQDHENYKKDPELSYNYDGYCQGYHCGIDLGGQWGDTVRAGIYGKVVNWGTGGGNWVEVKTTDGYTVRYQHLSEVFATQYNTPVTPTTILGEMGNPQNDESLFNYHIHLEIRYENDTKFTNPLNFIPHAKNGGRRTP